MSGTISYSHSHTTPSSRRRPKKKHHLTVQAAGNIVYDGYDLQSAVRVLKYHRRKGDLVAMFCDGRWYHHERDLS